METMAMIGLIGFLCIACFITGARVGQKVVKGQEISPIIKSPGRIITEIKENKEREKEIERSRIIAENIDNYDGTSLGQKDIPR